MENPKMVKFAGKLDKAALVGVKVFMITCIVCAVFAVLMLLFGDVVVEEGSFVLELGFVELHLTEEFQEVTPMMRWYTVIGLVSVCVLLFCIQYGLRIVRRILEPMKDGRPFAEETHINIGKLAWLVFIGGTVMQVLGVLEQVLLVVALPMDQILLSYAITEVDMRFRIDFGFVFAFLILRLMAYVFAYGQKLQTQSDETL